MHNFSLNSSSDKVFTMKTLFDIYTQHLLFFIRIFTSESIRILVIQFVKQNVTFSYLGTIFKHLRKPI